MCFQSGRMSIVEMCEMSLFEWALNMACDKAVVSASGWDFDSEIVVPFHFVLVSGYDEKIVS